MRASNALLPPPVLTPGISMREGGRRARTAVHQQRQLIERLRRDAVLLRRRRRSAPRSRRPPRRLFLRPDRQRDVDALHRS